jgi:nicotinamide riboside kinase
MRKVIVLVGSSSTGKSTIFELLKTKLSNYTFVSESTRKVKSYGYDINEQGDDTTQLAILSFHLKTLLEPGHLALDRGMLDVLVYSENLRDIQKRTISYIEDTFKYVKDEYTHVVYFPIEFDAVDDGVRSVNEEWRREVDNKFKQYLDKYYPEEYLTVTGSPMQRLKQILAFINYESR